MSSIIIILFTGFVIALPFILFYKWATRKMKEEREAHIKAGRKYQPTALDIACGRSGYH